MSNIILFFMGKEAREMMAMLWAQKIMLGKKTFADVPRLLKKQVREILIESGLEELVTE
ncbi:MAG: hypothetical protein IJS45_07490 [Clostridia bacterium]|nr:hypothetical protein [Clostridia bacterium]